MTTPSVGPRARALMHHFESCRLKAYPDPGTGGAPWTIGWGNTGPGITRGSVWTQDQADTMFARRLDEEFAPGVVKAIGGAGASPAQFGAMVSLAYNIGLGNFAKSSVARLHKAGDFDGAARAFAAWNKAAGKVMAGLTRRRAAEAALYRGDFAELARLTDGQVT